MCKTRRVCVCAWFTQILLQISFGFSYFFPVRTIFWDRASPPHHQTLFCSLSCFFVNCVSSSLGKLVMFRSGLCGYIPRICCVSLWTGNQKRGRWVTAHLLPAGPVHPPPEPTTGCSFISWVTTYKASQSSVCGAHGRRESPSRTAPYCTRACYFEKELDLPLKK